MDRRVRKSRQAMQQALLRLILHKGYDAITIQDIADEADTARVTFYRHYRDKEELLLDALEAVRQQLVAEIEEIPPEERCQRPLITVFYRHIEEHAVLYRLLFKSYGAMIIVNRVREYLAEQVKRVMLECNPRREETLPIPLEIVAQSAASLHIGLATWWLEQGCPYPAEYMAQAARWLLLSGRSQAITGEAGPLPPPEPPASGAGNPDHTT